MRLLGAHRLLVQRTDDLVEMVRVGAVAAESGRSALLLGRLGLWVGYKQLSYSLHRQYELELAKEHTS